MMSSFPQHADILIHGPFRQLSLLASSLLNGMCLHVHLQASGWYPFQHNPPHLANPIYISPLRLVLSHLTIKSTYSTLGSFIWLEAEEEYNNC